jgi:hypothetical protein
MLQVLEPCKDSKVFRPPNPWVQSILALVAEVYAQDKLKLNLKFEIEMLFRNLSLQISDAKPSSTLAAHKRQIINNADFAADKAIAPPPSAAPAGPNVSFFCLLCCQPVLWVLTQSAVCRPPRRCGRAHRALRRCREGPPARPCLCPPCLRRPLWCPQACRPSARQCRPRRKCCLRRLRHVSFSFFFPMPDVLSLSSPGPNQ